MKKIIATTILLASTVCAGLPAIAADLDVMQAPAGYTDVEYGSGWYLRGDIGYTASIDADGSFYADRRYQFTNQDVDQDWSFGGGAGFVFNDSFRTDVTIDYYDNFEWSGNSSGSNCGGTSTGECSSHSKVEGDLTNLMLNGYWHLGHSGGFSPYLSGGLGAAYVDFNKYSGTQTCTADPSEICPTATNTGTTVASYSTGYAYTPEDAWKFSYSLGAGVDYRLDDNWSLDVGYRYVNIHDGQFAEAGPNNLNGSVDYEDMEIHEIRAGLRYELW